MLKVYGIHGQTTAIVKIPVNGGKAWFEAEFKRGRIGGGPNDKPCTFATRDVTEQSIIEGSKYYGSLIRLIRTTEDVETAAPEKKANAAPAVEAHPEITSKAEAVAFIKKLGAKAKDYVDDEAIAAFAAKKGVSFPNLYE